MNLIKFQFTFTLPYKKLKWLGLRNYANTQSLWNIRENSLKEHHLILTSWTASELGIFYQMNTANPAKYAKLKKWSAMVNTTIISNYLKRARY